MKIAAGLGRELYSKGVMFPDYKNQTQKNLPHKKELHLFIFACSEEKEQDVFVQHSWVLRN